PVGSDLPGDAARVACKPLPKERKRNRIDPNNTPARKLFPVIFRATRCRMLESKKRGTMDGLINNLGFGPEALEHLDALFGYAMALTRDLTEAEDLVQETYLRAGSAASRADVNSNLKAWLFVIMRNAWLNQIRHRNNGPRFVELETGEQSIDETQE